MIDWPPQLVRDCARRRVVVVIGSGISKHSVGRLGAKPPTWRQFLDQALADCPVKDNLAAIQEAIVSGDYLHACEWLKQRYDEDWVGYLRTTFNRAYKPAQIHDSILNLDSRIVFSLNFDDIYERHATNVQMGAPITKVYSDPDISEFMRGDGRYIIKVHGSLNSADSLIFTQKDYSKARTKNSAFYQAFDATLLTHTFLFLGSGYNDPDINLILENQNFGFPLQSPHYFVTGSGIGDDRKNSLRQNRNLKVLTYDPIDDDHSGLVTEIDALRDLVDSERFDLASNASW